MKLSLVILFLFFTQTAIGQTGKAKFEIEVKRYYLDSLDKSGLDIKDTILITFYDTTKYQNIKVKWVTDELQYVIQRKHKYLRLNSTTRFTSDSTLVINQHLDQCERYMDRFFKRRYGMKSMPLPYQENLYITTFLVYNCVWNKWVHDKNEYFPSLIIKN